MTHRGTYGCNQRERSTSIRSMFFLITPLEEGFENLAQHAPRSFVFFLQCLYTANPGQKSFWKLSGILDISSICQTKLLLVVYTNTKLYYP